MLKKILLSILVVIVLIVTVFAIVVASRQNLKFDAPFPDIIASADSAVIARGEYLVYGPAHCAHCHAPLSMMEKVEAGEKVPLSGGFTFKLPIADIHVSNITPDTETGIGKLTDGQIARALRYGINRHGEAIIDFMPFYDLSDDDLTAIISFLRVQEPIHNEVPAHEWNLLGRVVKSFLIKPMGDDIVPEAPQPDSTVAYGNYLSSSIANCRGCHTNRDMMTGAFIGPEYAGQFKMEIFDLEKGEIIDGKHLVSQNLTPDIETGRMADWTQEQFVKRFRIGRVIPGSPMPWGPFSRMSDTELIALYKFFQTIEPVKSETPLGIQEGNPM
jgi:mono/diheme cytochrome c family protein